ncbi:MAG: hypothetical protein ACXVPQ_04880 [Bacteroidia bacterium]
MDQKGRNRINHIAIILMFMVAANALIAGCLLMADPSGKKLGLSLALLRFSPFDNFFLPGMILFSVNGLLSLITGIALIRRWPYYPIGLCIQGVLLTGWIAVQVCMIRELNILHAVLAATGVFFVAAGIILPGGADQ